MKNSPLILSGSAGYMYHVIIFFVINNIIVIIEQFSIIVVSIESY